MKILLASSSFHGGGITSYALVLINHYSVSHELYLMIGETNGYINENTFSNIIHANTNDITVENAQKVIKLINDLNPEVLLVSFARVVGLIIPYLNDNIRIITVSHSLRYDESDISAFHAPFTDKIIALSHHNKIYLKKKFKITDEEKIHVVYNFINQATEIPTIIEKKTSTHKPIIVFAGGGAPTKTPELVYSILLELIKKPIPFRFYWLGNTNPPLKKIQKFKKIEHIVPPDSRVFFTGKISRSEATSILSQANIILTPSRREGCPMALLEAMSAGAIVITSDFKNACREIVEDAKCGIIIPHKKNKTFASTIYDIITQPSLYEHFYDRAIDYFEQKLSLTAWKAEMDKLIEEREKQHKPRITFSRDKYIKTTNRWKKCSKFNFIHMFITETLPSALSFWCKYLHYSFNKFFIHNRTTCK